MPILPFQLTLWDVGHGLAVWIQTPSGHNHWVDTGCLPKFSPDEHVYYNYGVSGIDYLTISHADKDHFDEQEFDLLLNHGYEVADATMAAWAPTVFDGDSDSQSSKAEFGRLSIDATALATPLST
jgi:beta-lactamase superfamily II metal-dependent hydrolase